MQPTQEQIQIVEVEQQAFDTAQSCQYLGGVSPKTLWAVARKFGYKRNPFGRYNREDLDGMRLGKAARKKG